MHAHGGAQARVPPLVRWRAGHKNILTGQRTARLLHAASFLQRPQVDHCEAEALYELTDLDLGIGMVSGDEDDTAGRAARRTGSVGRHPNGVECLHYAGIRSMSGYDFARTLVSEVSQDEVGRGAEERVRGVNQDAALPRR